MQVEGLEVRYLTMRFGIPRSYITAQANAVYKLTLFGRHSSTSMHTFPYTFDYYWLNRFLLHVQ